MATTTTHFATLLAASMYQSAAVRAGLGASLEEDEAGGYVVTTHGPEITTSCLQCGEHHQSPFEDC